MISRMDFRHDPANEKYRAEWTAAKILIIKSFDPTLRITKFCCRAVPDDRFGVLNDPTCTNVGFSLSSLSRKEGIWRQMTTKFSCSRLAVNISRCLVACCAEQPPVSSGGSLPRYRAKKKGCMGRKQEFIFKSEAWDLHFV